MEKDLTAAHLEAERQNQRSAHTAHSAVRRNHTSYAVGPPVSHFDSSGTASRARHGGPCLVYTSRQQNGHRNKSISVEIHAARTILVDEFFYDLQLE